LPPLAVQLGADPRHAAPSANNVPRASAMRRFASAAYSLSFSMPMKRRPSLMHATPVEPEPQNGSSTMSPGRVTSRMSHAASCAGYTAGWLTPLGVRLGENTATSEHRAMPDLTPSLGLTPHFSA